MDGSLIKKGSSIVEQEISVINEKTSKIMERATCIVWKAINEWAVDHRLNFILVKIQQNYRDAEYMLIT